MSENRLNAYRIMWLFVFFDLPVTTKKERKEATTFRKKLLQCGFTMMQFSVYIRHCGSHESMQKHKASVKGFVPPAGKVSMLGVTDRQYGDIENFWGTKAKIVPRGPIQLEIF